LIVCSASSPMFLLPQIFSRLNHAADESLRESFR
jgi:hypothetical protein